MTKSKVLLVWSAALLVLGVPTAAADTTPVALPPPVERAPEDALYVRTQFSYTRTAEDVVYGTAPNVEGETQDLRLDVYEPDGNDAQFRPVIVWATGGGFIRAGKENLYFAPWLLERGYVVVSIDYRIHPDLPYGFLGIVEAGPDAAVEFLAAARDAQHDMQAAIRWVRANAADLRADPGNIVAAGYSAGGIMSLLTAYNSDDPGDSGNSVWPSHVAAAVSGAGAYGSGIQGTIEPGEPPVTILHGTHDTTVPIVGSLAPCANAIAMANVCEARIFVGEDHDMRRPELWPDFARETADFLYRNVIAAERTPTQFVDVGTAAHGETVTVTGWLTTAEGEPLGGARVLGRATSGWAGTTTDSSGAFVLPVDAADHGRSTELLLRYEGHSTGSWLDGPQVAPTHTTASATWGR